MCCGVIYFIWQLFLDCFTTSHEPTVQLRKTKCMRMVINANALGTEWCTGTAVKGSLVCPVILS